MRVGPKSRWGIRRHLAGFAALGVATLAATVTGYAANLPLDSQNLTVFRTCILTATPSGTSVVADTYVASNSATSNFGTATAMYVQSGNAGGNRRVYVSFDLAQCSPAIPASATVHTAVLRTFVTAIPSPCRTNGLYRVTSAWTEAGITWNTQPTVGSVTASIGIGSEVGCQNRTTSTYVSGWEVASDVQAFVSGSATNRGWMIRDAAEGSGTSRTSTFTTKNAGTLAQAPQLVVVYRL